MKWFLCVLAGCLAVAAVSGAADPPVIRLTIVAEDKNEKIDKDNKIVGVWKATKLAPGLPMDVRWKFDKDGSLTLLEKAPVNGAALKQENGRITLVIPERYQPLEGAGGTYKVEGNKLTITLKTEKDGKELTHKTTITKLTDKELQTKDEKGNVNEFTRK